MTVVSGLPNRPSHIPAQEVVLGRGDGGPLTLLRVEGTE